jgi:hypothetical protein
MLSHSPCACSAERPSRRPRASIINIMYGIASSFEIETDRPSFSPSFLGQSEAQIEP